MRGPGRRARCQPRLLKSSQSPDDIDLRYAQAGEHFRVFIDMLDELVIIYILHERSDLPARLQ